MDLQKFLSEIFSDINFDSFNPNINFEYFASKQIQTKISNSKSFLDNYLKENKMKLSPFDKWSLLDLVEKTIKSRQKELTEITYEKEFFWCHCFYTRL